MSKWLVKEYVKNVDLEKELNAFEEQGFDVPFLFSEAGFFRVVARKRDVQEPFPTIQELIADSFRKKQAEDVLAKEFDQSTPVFDPGLLARQVDAAAASGIQRNMEKRKRKKR